MKIDEASINHNAMFLIEKVVYEIRKGEFPDDKFENFTENCINYTLGVIDLANSLKSVLKN